MRGISFFSAVFSFKFITSVYHKPELYCPSYRGEPRGPSPVSKRPWQNHLVSGSRLSLSQSSFPPSRFQSFQSCRFKCEYAWLDNYCLVCWLSWHFYLRLLHEEENWSQWGSRGGRFSSRSLDCSLADHTLQSSDLINTADFFACNSKLTFVSGHWRIKWYWKGGGN